MTDKDCSIDNLLEIQQSIRSFADIKHEDFIIKNILWDVLPADLMKPQHIPEARDKGKIKGYVFYIETVCEQPQLFLMRHTEAGYAETLAVVDYIPEEMLIEAIEQNKDKEFFKMYPINDKIKKWLLADLGLS